MSFFKKKEKEETQEEEDEGEEGRKITKPILRVCSQKLCKCFEVKLNFLHIFFTLYMQSNLKKLRFSHFIT